MATNTKGRGEGGKNVTTHGTPVQLVSTKTQMGAVVITARPANTGVIAVGFSNAVRAVAGGEVGATLKANASITIPGVADLSQIWIDATVDGEGVSFTYFTPLEVYGG